MPVFEEVKVTWKGAEHAIPARQVLAAIAEVEEIFTLGELALVQERGRLPLAKLARAYAVVLRHAGVAGASWEDVYAGMFEGAGKDMTRRALSAVYTLQALMVPPEYLRAAAEPGKDASGGARRAASSRNASRSSAGRGG